MTDSRTGRYALRAVPPPACETCMDTGWKAIGDGRSVTSCECSDEAKQRRAAALWPGIAELLPSRGFAQAYIDGRKTLETVRILSPAHVTAIAAMKAITGWRSTAGCRLNALLRGPAGVGKTHMVEAAGVSFAHEQGVAPLLWNVKLLGTRLQAASSPASSMSIEDIINDACNTRLLVIDDIGASRVTRFVLDYLYLIIDHRSRHELLTIATCNYSMRDLAARLVPSDGGDLLDAQRVVDRVEELFPLVITLGGDSQRSIVNREQPE